MVPEKQVKEEQIAQKKIEEFVTRLREAAGANLQSVIVYGSAATDDFHPEFSNINIFCVLRETSFAALQALTPAVAWWTKQKQPPPLCMTQEEITRSADVFAIELTDMQQHHRIAYGDNVLQGLIVPTQFHRIQVEYELREKLLLLRQHVLAAAGNDRDIYDKQIWDLLIRSVSSFATLFRHALTVLGQTAPLKKREAVMALAKHLAFDPSGFLSVLDVREGKSDRKKMNAHDIFSRYLKAVEHVTAAVDRMLDSDI